MTAAERFEAKAPAAAAGMEPGATQAGRSRPTGRGNGRAAALGALLLLQGGSALFFLLDVASDYGFAIGFTEEPLHHRAEIVAVLTLVLGMVLTAVQIRQVLRRQRSMESQLRAAAGAFAEVVAEQFDAWGLTPSEREVALLALKGFAIAEIARLRGTRPGTVKAQLNAIYAKAGVSGRQQLMSLFIEELMSEGLAAALPGGAREGAGASASRPAPAGPAEAREEPERQT